MNYTKFVDIVLKITVSDFLTEKIKVSIKSVPLTL